MSRAHIAASVANHVVDDAVQLGVEREEALAMLATTPMALADPEGRLPAARVHDLVERIVEIGGDDAYLERWTSRRFADFGALGFLAATCPDMRTSLQRICRYLPVIATDLVLRVVEGDETFQLVVTSACAPRRAVQARITGVIGLALTFGRALTKTWWAPRRVHLPGPALPMTPLRRRLFGDAVTHPGRWRGVLDADRLVLDLPLDRSDPEIAAFFEKRLSEQIASLEGAGTVVDEVRELLLTSLPEGASLAWTARQLGMSSRTLQRRLSDAGTSYHRQLDELRHQLAERYMAEGSSIGEVAFALGFSEPSAFHRAFKRWTGRTPRQWRQ